jgi:hypothetical protein
LPRPICAPLLRKSGHADHSIFLISTGRSLGNSCPKSVRTSLPRPPLASNQHRVGFSPTRFVHSCPPDRRAIHHSQKAPDSNSIIAGRLTSNGCIESVPATGIRAFPQYRNAGSLPIQLYRLTPAIHPDCPNEYPKKICPTFARLRNPRPTRESSIVIQRLRWYDSMSSGIVLGIRVCCAVRRDLANDFAIAARLYAEAVVIFTSGVVSGSNLAELRGWLRDRRRNAPKKHVWRLRGKSQDKAADQQNRTLRPTRR